MDYEVGWYFCERKTRNSVRRATRHFPRQRRPHGKKIVPARLAAQRRHSQDSPDRSGHSLHSLRSHPLQFEIAAQAAVRIHPVPHRHCARSEPRLATSAAPRQQSAKTKQIVCQISPLRSPYPHRSANRALHNFGSRLDSTERVSEILQIRQIAKSDATQGTMAFHRRP